MYSRVLRFRVYSSALCKPRNFDTLEDAMLFAQDLSLREPNCYVYCCPVLKTCVFLDGVQQ